MDKAINNNKILIVDDVPLNISVLKEILKSDYDVYAARTGEQALSIAFGKNTPDLILLDIMMPEMSGYDMFNT